MQTRCSSVSCSEQSAHVGESFLAPVSVQALCHIAAIEPHAEQKSAGIPADVCTQWPWYQATHSLVVGLHRPHNAGQDDAGLVKGGDVNRDWGAFLIGLLGQGILVAPDAEIAQHVVESQVASLGGHRVQLGLKGAPRIAAAVLGWLDACSRCGTGLQSVIMTAPGLRCSRSLGGRWPPGAVQPTLLVSWRTPKYFELLQTLLLIAASVLLHFSVPIKASHLPGAA